MIEQQSFIHEDFGTVRVVEQGVNLADTLDRKSTRLNSSHITRVSARLTPPAESKA